MENQYGITVANKYALFLNEDEDPLEILKLQEATKTSKKSEKSKKSAPDENEVKTTSNKQNAASSGSSQKKAEKIDHFSSPTQSDEKSRGKDKELDSSKQPKDKPKRPTDRSNADQQKQKNDGSGSARYDRDRPRRDRPNRGGFGSGRADREGRSEQQDDTQQERPAAEQTDQGTFDRPVRDGFSSRPPRYERAGFRGSGRPRGGFNRGGFGERLERSGFDEQPAERTFYGGDRPPRRGGYRGRRGDRSGFGERSGFGDRSERTDADDADSQDQGGFDNQQRGETSNQQRDRGGFGEWKERQGFEETAERSGFDDRGSGREFVRRGRGGGRGFGRGRGGFDRPGKRDYDRHTEGGMRPPDKRDGAGSHNWGTVQDDMEGQEADKFVSEGGSTWAEQTDAEERAAAAAERDGETGSQQDEDTKVMTLDEWKSMEETKRVKTEFNIRKAGEGCSSDPQWKKMYALTKKEKAEVHEDDEDLQEYDAHHGKQKNLLSIDIRFADNPRRGGGNIGRGGRGRGGRGRGVGSDNYRDSQNRGGYRDDRPRARSSGSYRDRAPNVADEMDFPSLDKTLDTGRA